MNVITLASRKGGSGKSTLTAHLAAYAQKLGKRSLILDADPQGSLTLWHSLRAFAHPTPRPGNASAHAARLCISLAPACAPRIAATERSIADHSRATSWPAAESGATSPALNPAASEAM